MGEIVHTHRYEKSKSKHADELAKERAANTRALRLRNEMLLAKARGELITKQLVERQAAYLLVALRQRIMSMPSTYARRMVNLPDTKAAAAVLKEIAISVLDEIRDLPSRVSDLNWLDKLENGDGEQA
jgi:hypothetical protein